MLIGVTVVAVGMHGYGGPGAIETTIAVPVLLVLILVAVYGSVTSAAPRASSSPWPNRSADASQLRDSPYLSSRLPTNRPSIAKSHTRPRRLTLSACNSGRSPTARRGIMRPRMR
jgi:hypothetical protein